MKTIIFSILFLTLYLLASIVLKINECFTQSENLSTDFVCAAYNTPVSQEIASHKPIGLFGFFNEFCSLVLHATSTSSFLFTTFLFFTVFMFSFLSFLKNREVSIRTLFFILVLYFCTVLPYTHDLLQLIYCFVSLNVSVYALMLNGSRASVYSALCYFLLGSLAISFLFLSLGIWLAVFGDIAFSAVSHNMFAALLTTAYGNNDFIDIYCFLSTWVACTFVVIPLFFKLGLFPFHFYLPLVYSSVDRLALFAITVPVKLSILITFLKFIGYFYFIFKFSYLFFWVVGVASMVVGTFGAAAETNWRKYWSYSYMNNIGTTFLGFNFYLSGFGSSIVILYFYTYLLQWVLVYLLGCFLFTWRINKKLTISERIAALGSKSVFYEITYISQLAEIGQVGVFRWLLFPILISLAGIPPMLSFWTKFSIFIGMFEQLGVGSFWFVSIIILLIPLNAFNYLRLIKLMGFIGEGSSALKQNRLYVFAFNPNLKNYFIVFIVGCTNTLMFVLPLDYLCAYYTT